MYKIKVGVFLSVATVTLLMTSAIVISHLGLGTGADVEAKKKKHSSDSLPSVRAPESDSGSSSSGSPIIFFDRPTPTNDAQIMDGVSKHKDAIGIHLIGEVKNNADDTIRFAKITATYYDVQNHTIGTDFTFTDPTDIPAGSLAPFDLLSQSSDVLKEANMVKLHLDFQ